MDALSSSVSSFKVPKIHPTTREIHYLKTPNASSHLPPHPHLSSSTTTTTTTTTKPPNSISTKPPSSFSRNNLITPPFPSSFQLNPSAKQAPKTIHQNAASGYAAALIDAALCNNSLESIHRDVKRFSKWLTRIMADPSVEGKEKGKVIKEVAEKGRFRRHLVVLVKMLVAKNKFGVVGEVLEEFERIYDELSGTAQVVFLSASKKKMEADQVVGIAKRECKSLVGYEGEGEAFS